MRWSNAAAGNGSASADPSTSSTRPSRRASGASEHLGALVEARDAKAPLVQAGRDEPGARRDVEHPAAVGGQRERRGTGASADPGRTRAPRRPGRTSGRAARRARGRDRLGLTSRFYPGTVGLAGRPGADRGRRDGRRHGQRHPRDRACAGTPRLRLRVRGAGRRIAPGSRWTATGGRFATAVRCATRSRSPRSARSPRRQPFPATSTSSAPSSSRSASRRLPRGSRRPSRRPANLQHVLGAPPHLATAARLDEIGYAARRLEQALDPTAPSPFTSTMRSAAAVADALWEDVQAAYRGSLT